jgi:AcrR family transcriptional regulator
MARPRSEDKQKAILDAAVEEFAVRGVWSTPTSAISKAAGVAEGTLFTYFATKDVLVNALYRALKLELADAMMGDYPQACGPATWAGPPRTR